MRVLLANKYFHVKGGAERAFFDLDASLRAAGHETVHFAMTDDANEPSPWSRYFVSSVSYDQPALERGTLSAIARMFYSREVHQKVAALVRAAQPDVAVLHNTYHQLGPPLVMQLAAAGVPIVMVLHDYKVTCPSYQRVRGGEECSRCAGGRFYEALLHGCGGSRARGAMLTAEAYWQWRVLGTYGRVQRYVSPSRYLIAAVRGMGFPYPLTFLRNAVRTPVAAVDPAANRALGFAGRLSVEKGLDVLLEAAAGLPHVPFRIVGDGPELPALRRRIVAQGLDHVQLLGRLPHAEVVREMATWRAAVVPSLWPENCPYAVLEPLSLGVPVVGSALGGIPELLDGRGVLVPAGNAEAWRAALAALWDDGERCRDLGRAGRRFVRTECDPESVGGAWDRLLGELVTAPVGSPPKAERRAVDDAEARS